LCGFVVELRAAKLGKVLAAEIEIGAAGELGWSAEWRKLKLSKAAPELRSARGGATPAKVLRHGGMAFTPAWGATRSLRYRRAGAVPP